MSRKERCHASAWRGSRFSSLAGTDGLYGDDAPCSSDQGEGGAYCRHRAVALPAALPYEDRDWDAYTARVYLTRGSVLTPGTCQ